MATQQAIVVENSHSPIIPSPAQVETQTMQRVIDISRSSTSSPTLKPTPAATSPEQKSTEVPPSTARDYPIDIHIEIYRGGTGYEVTISPSGGRASLPRVPVDLSPHTLATSIEQLQKWMQTIAAEKASAETELQEMTQAVAPEKAGTETELQELTQAIAAQKMRTDAELRKLLRPLARDGYVAFKKIFSQRRRREYIEELLRSNPNQGASMIQIASKDFFFPWELIYPVSQNDEPLSYERFWGMNHIIYHHVYTDPCPGAYVTLYDIPAPPKLGLLTYDGLKGVKDKEIPFFDDLEKNRRIHLFKLRALNPERQEEGIREFIAFWQESLDLAHFACHAFHKDQLPDRPGIRLSREFDILLHDMVAYDLELSGHPLIIMNACGTGAMNPLYTSHFVREFIKYGALGVVATECAVPDDFAADFAEQLYTYLLSGKELGESLLATRRHFWKKDRNPSGLLYSMYAPPLIRISQIRRMT